MSKQNRKRRLITPQSQYEEPEGPKNKRILDATAASEEEQLNQILFGGTSSFLKSLEEAEQEQGSSNIDSGLGEESEDSEKCPAWHDEDDDGIEVGHALDIQGRSLPAGGINDRHNKYSNILRAKFNTALGTPTWANLDRKQDSDSDDEILRSCGFIRKNTKASLPQGLLEFKKVKDLNCETYAEGPYVNVVEFHQGSRAALVAGNNGVASVYAVDGKRNNKLHSILFENFPILCAKFIHGGNEAILGSRHSHIFSYDLMAAKSFRVQLPPGLTRFKKFVVSPDGQFLAAAGKWGHVHILTAGTKERIANLKQNSEVTALAYNQQGNLLYGHSDTGEITVWDMTMRRITHKFLDEGCLQGTSLDVSSSNQFLAAGSAQGIVNLYKVTDVLASKTPKPRKAINNLTTAINDLKFNSTSEILALSSADIQNAVKLFHIGSGTVFSNFPCFGTKLGNVNVLNISPNSGYIAFGNRKSTVALYTLKHYKNY